MKLEVVFAGCALSALMLLGACHGDSPSTPPAPPIQVVVSPGSGSVLPRNTLQFQAKVLNATSQAVVWSVEPGGGSITSTGLYSAPETGGPYRVIATALVDERASGQASVTLLPGSGIHVSLDIQNVQLLVGQKQTFQAILAHDAGRQGVTWQVLEKEGGTVDAAGQYTAPLTPGTYRLRATSMADSAQCAQAVIQVFPEGTLATGLALQTPEPDPSMWHLVSVPNGTGGVIFFAAPGTIFVQVHAPLGLVGRGWALKLAVNSDRFDGRTSMTYLPRDTQDSEWNWMNFPGNGFIDMGEFAWGSGPISLLDQNTGQMLAREEVPLEGHVVISAIQPKDTTPLRVGQSFPLTIIKAGRLTREGVMVDSTAIQPTCLRAVVR